MPATPTSTYESLGSSQVALLLRSLSKHRRMLEAAHQDEKRCSATGLRPCYLVDYDQLYRYMYEGNSQPDAFVELKYLFSQPDVTFIVGYGTALEVNHRITVLAGLDPTSVSEEADFDTFQMTAAISLLRSDPALTLERLLRDEPQEVEAFVMLRDLLSQENFCEMFTLEREYGHRVVDLHAFDLSRKALQARRAAKRYSYPNVADALNWASVIGLRALAAQGSFSEFPFLLTSTRPLLDESDWGQDTTARVWGLESAVSRDPLTAVYSHIISSLDPDPETACIETAALLHKISVAELDLRLSRGYQSDLDALSERAWEDLLTLGELAEPLRRQVRSISQVANDNLLSEAQRILDNTRQQAINLRSLQGFREQIESPRRLFDLMVGVARVVGDPLTKSRVLSSYWKAGTNTQRLESFSHTRVVFADGADQRQMYLQVELHKEGYACLSWPTLMSLDDLLGAFVWGFSRHQCESVVLHVGTSTGVEEFDVQFPMSVNELLNEVSQTVYWIRMDGPDFDVYADILVEPDTSPLVGVLAYNPNPDHIADLFAATSSRFLFRSWLVKMLEDAGLLGRDET